MQEAFNGTITGICDFYTPPRTGSKVAPGCKVAQSTDTVARVDFYALATPINVNTTASLVFTVFTFDGSNGTITAPTMLAGASGFNFTNEANSEYQEFSYGGSLVNLLSVGA